MPEFSIGDLSQQLVLRRQNTFLKENLLRLTQELSSGRASDVAKHTAGRFTELANLEHSSTVLERQSQVIVEVGSQASVRGVH